MSAVTRALYKSLLRAANKLDKLQAPVASELGRFSLPTTPLETYVDFRHIVRHQFNSLKSASTSDVPNLQNAAMRGLALANQRASALLDAQEEEEITLARPANVVYSVGQSFRHKKYGYRAVIIGWDDTCKAGQTWINSTGVASLPNGTNQPFYRVLVDVRDRPKAQVSYVAQDNIELLSGTAGDAITRLVVHPLVTKYFDEFRPVEGYYVPNRALSSEFPDDNPAVLHPEAAFAKGVVKAVGSVDLRQHIFSGRTSDESGSDSDSERPLEKRPRTSSTTY